MKKIILVILSLLAYNTSKADELSLIAHGISKHIDTRNYNERNIGTGIRLQRDEIGVQLGTYYNSFRKESVYLGIDWIPFQKNIKGCLKIEAGPYYGVITGYKYAITPTIGLQSAVRCDKVFVRVRAFPDAFYGSKGAVALEAGLVLTKF